MTPIKKAGIFIGLSGAILIYLLMKSTTVENQIAVMASIAFLMASWWITEAIPLAATAMIPLVLFPLTGVLKAELTAGSYINSIIFLFLGGFLIALAMEKWELHKRIALKITLLFGGTPVSIIIGFMTASAFLSMWISNTATCIMMFPIALAVINRMEENFDEKTSASFSTTLLLSIAYSCTLGGVATLVGTVPNLVFVQTFKILFPQAPSISFGEWMMLGVPVAILMLTVTALLLTRFFLKTKKSLKISKQILKDEYSKLGSITFAEKIIGCIFLATAVLWIFRSDLNFGIVIIPGWQNIFSIPEYIDDGTVAITMALLLFLIPVKGTGKMLLDQKVFTKIPWDIILLFGGGFALAKGFVSTGLSEFIGGQIKNLGHLSPILLIIITAASISFLTELTSNTATTQMILPILAPISVALGMNPLLLMLTATLSASMAFMLPVATPPNTIIFASSRIKIKDMVKAGFGLNISGIVIISLLVYFLGDFLFGLSELPAWLNQN